MRSATLLVLALALPATVLAAYDLPAWEDDAMTLGLQIEKFDLCRGRMAEKPRFKGCLLMWDDARIRVKRMEDFGKERPDPFRTARFKKQREQLDAATAFIAPEVRALPRETYAKLMANNKDIAKLKPDIEAMRKAPAPAPAKP